MRCVGESVEICGYEPGDDPEIVDIGKLEMQSEIGFELARALANSDQRAAFTNAPPVVFEDAEHILEVFDQAVANDLDLFAPADAEVIEQFHADLTSIVAAGPAAFDGAAIGTFLTGVVAAIDLVVDLPCDGFLEE